AGTQHDRRVRGVGARGNGSNHDGAVIELELATVIQSYMHRLTLTAGSTHGRRDLAWLVGGIVLSIDCRRVTGGEGLGAGFIGRALDAERLVLRRHARRAAGVACILDAEI